MQSVLHRVVREYLDVFLREAREHGGLPAFIENTFRAYLKCGIPEHGFIRLHCDGCGHDDLVASSCKKRGVCPICAARAAADGAAHLVDHVLPHVPWRQWVVNWPFEFGGNLAFQPGRAARVRTRVDGHDPYVDERAQRRPRRRREREFGTRMLFDAACPATA